MTSAFGKMQAMAVADEANPFPRKHFAGGTARFEVQRYMFTSLSG